MYQQRQFYQNNRAMTIASWLLVAFCVFLAAIVVDQWFFGGRYLYNRIVSAAGSGETVITAPPSSVQNLPDHIRGDQTDCSGVVSEYESGWIDSCNRWHEKTAVSAPAPSNSNQDVVFSHEVTPLPPNCEQNYQYFDDYWIDGCGNVQQYAAAGQRPEVETGIAVEFESEQITERDACLTLAATGYPVPPECQVYVDDLANGKETAVGNISAIDSAWATENYTAEFVQACAAAAVNNRRSSPACAGALRELGPGR